jgi:two-component system sensor histidine kinase YesM
MKKKLALSTVTLIFLLSVFIVNILLVAYIVDELYSQANLAGQPYLFLAYFLLNLGFAAAFYFLVVIPYLRIRKLNRMFLNGQIYEELFQEKSYLTPELLPVMNRFYHLLNKQDAINMSNKQAEYLALQNQINPHFLYNTLEAIRGDALYAGISSIAETAEALAAFFRYTITDVGNLVTLEDELENVENYFTIQQYRFGDKFKMNIHFPDNEEIVRLQLPKLTLQPIIENAIFHGLEGKAEGGRIDIRFETTKKHLFISITDDGLGISQDALNKINDSLERAAVSYVSGKRGSGGIALKNVSRRIKLLFGDEYGVHLYSTPHVGTDVRITLPRIQAAENN